MKTKKDSKFNLEKFEVAKLKNMQLVKGGVSNDGETIRKNNSSKACQAGPSN